MEEIDKLETCRWKQFELQTSQAATRKLGEQLSIAYHLQNVEALKFSIVHRKTMLEVKTMVQSLLEEAKESYRLLDVSNAYVKQMESSFENTEELCYEVQSQIGHDEHSVIREVSRTRNNLALILKELGRLTKIPEQGNPANHLLTSSHMMQVYHEVQQLETMRDDAYRHTGTDPEEIQALELCFKPVDQLIADFESQLLEVGNQALDLAQKRPSVLVKALQVVERQEEYDKLLRAKLVSQKKDPDDDRNSRLFKRYKERFFIQMKAKVTDRFESTFLNCDTAGQTLREIQNIIDDLTTVLDEVIQCFPPTWNIFEFFFKEYHIRFNTMFMVYSTDPTKITPQEIIDLISWVNSEYEPQLARLGIPDPQPRLVEALEPLYDHYREHIRKLMDEWSTNIIEQDKEKEPEMVGGHYVTLAPTMLFESIHTQINVGKMAQESKFLNEVLQECVVTFSVFQEMISRVLREEWRELPMEFIMAQVNNGSNCCDQVEDMAQYMIGLLDDQYKMQIEASFPPISKGFHEVSMEAVQIIVEVIFGDLEAPLQQLFQPEWYEGALTRGRSRSESINIGHLCVAGIINTIESYLSDIDGVIMEGYFKKLAVACMDRIVDEYVIQLFSRKQFFEDDTRIMMEVFSKHVKPATVETRLKILSDLRGLIDAEADMISLYLHGLLQRHPDATMSVVEALLRMRKDLSKSEMSEALGGCSKIMEQHRSTGENAPDGFRQSHRALEFRSMTTPPAADRAEPYLKQACSNGDGIRDPYMFDMLRGYLFLIVLFFGIAICLPVTLKSEELPSVWHPVKVPHTTLNILKNLESSLSSMGLSVSRVLSQTHNREELIRKEHATHITKKLNDTGYGGVEKLIDLMKGDECDRSFLGLCKRGTLKIDPWLLNTLELQRNLSRDLPLNYFPFLATHNSYNNRADGYGEYNGDLLIDHLLKVIFSGEDYVWIYAQQEYSMTDQLRMGIRALHLDPHYVFGAVRLCHSGADIAFVDTIAKLYFEYYNETMDWNSANLFCSPWDRTWTEGLTEIKEWLDLPENKEEFVFIHHDEQKYFTWNQTELVEGPIRDIFGDMLFTPPELMHKYGGRWPSTNELIAQGKRILFQSEITYGAHNGTLIFKPFLIPGWMKNCIKYFTEYPECGGYEPGTWSNWGGEGQMATPFYDGSKDCGVVTPQNAGKFIECAPSYLGFDEVSPTLLRSAVWTWREGEPSRPGCAVLHEDGRWTSQDCGEEIHRATRGIGLWVVADEARWGDEEGIRPGFQFTIPQTGHEQRQLLDVMRREKIEKEHAKAVTYSLRYN
ncbi:hypothetical protein PROFUN_12730 [Planoprotostelium fungivorum]|uniref:Uncharacterized protein n=1 Tax=Planoprotostelium fungivorum TaxID=1890364 RepID=A0A2P6N8I3_9EUKA|nr:hypothetical protein PROFUN_12730 [Planoprotostelium fungivorum]